MDTEPRFVLTPRLVLGVCIALFGVILTLDRFRLLDADRVLRYWPVALMIVGGLTVVQAESSRARTRGIVLTAVGLWVFLNMQGVLSASIWELFWPIMLIVIGSSLALQTSRRPRTFGGRPIEAASRLSTFSVWSSCRRASNASPFRGGDITAVMGGAQIDLRQAVIPPGEDAVLDVLAVMGGVELFVPSSWAVATPIIPFMGAVEDRRLPAIGPPAKDPVPRLVLRGLVMMGGVHIKN